jgi:hypothetical protein
MHPVSWIASDKPLDVDGLLYSDSVEEQFHISASPEIASSQGRSGQVDDDDIQSPPSPSRPHSTMKRRRLEYDGNSDVECSPTYKRPRPESSMTNTDERFPDAHLISSSEQEQPVASASFTLPPSLGPLPSYVAPATSCPADLPLDIALVSRSADHSDAALPNQLPPSSLSCHDIEPVSPLSRASTSLASSSQVPLPCYASYNYYPSCLGVEELEAQHHLPPQLDYTLDSSSDSRFSSVDSIYGSWADSLSLFSRGAHVILEDEQPPFDAINAPDCISIFGSSLEADIRSSGGCQLDGLRPPGEPIAVQHKRKRLFLTDEDEHEGRTSKKRSIER